MLSRIFAKIGNFLVSKAKSSIIIMIILTIFFTFGLSKIHINMGNELFVDSNSQAFKDSVIYQENFGGEGLYLLISADPDHLITHDTVNKITVLTNESRKITGITDAINYVTLMDELLKSKLIDSFIGLSSETNHKNKELSDTLQKEIPEEEMKKIQYELQQSLTEQQSNQIVVYTQGLLSTEQKQKVASELVSNEGSPTKEQQQQITQSTLTSEQKELITEYTNSILTPEQLKSTQLAVLEALPNIEDLSTEALQSIVFSDEGKVPEALKQLLPQNGHHMIISFSTANGLNMDSYSLMVKELNEQINNIGFDENIVVKIAGTPAVNSEIKGEVTTTMASMLGLSVVLMIIVLFLVFPVRRRLLSLAYVLVGLIWTFGFMGWTGIPVTLATMATLPIIIGLGTDFGVQFHNRYEEEFRASNANVENAIVNAVKHIGPAVGIAILIMSLSFLTMYLSKAPMMQQFGLTLAIGVVINYVVILILMFSTFSLIDKKPKKLIDKNIEDSWLSRFLPRYATGVRKFAIPILLIAFILSGIGFANEHKVEVETNMQEMIPQDMVYLQNSNQLQEVVGSTSFITYLVNAKDVTQGELLTWLQEFGQKVDSEYTEVESVSSLATILSNTGVLKQFDNQQSINEIINEFPGSLMKTMISENHQYAKLQFQINQDLSSTDQLTLLNSITNEINPPTGVTVSPAGARVLSIYGVDNIVANSYLMKIAGLAIIFIGLFLVYRRVKHAIYPIVPIILVLGFSPGALLLLGMSYNPLTTALSCLVLGIGTEFTILIMERFREEEANGLNADEAIKVALSKVGPAIIASGATVVIGFSTLMFVSFPVLQGFGITTVIDTLLCLLCAITILPVLITLFQKKK